MTIFNRVAKAHEIKTCLNFAEAFVDKFLKESQEFDKIRLVFDRYIEYFLKERTRKIQNKGMPVKYLFQDSTNIEEVYQK